MKKTLLSFFFIISIVTLSAQVIQDGSFETKWGTYAAESGNYLDYSYEDSLDLLMTLNILYQLPADPIPGELTAYRETDAQDGNYAIRLTSKNLGGILLVPGALGTISNNFIEQFLSSEGIISVKKEFPFKPLALKGYYKYTPVNGDSAAIDMELFNGSVSIAKAQKIEYNTVSSWTFFNLPFVYSDTTLAATHIKLLFVASAGYNFNDLMSCVGQINSSLYIDNIYFEYENGLTESLLPIVKVTVYPNPSTDFVTFDFNREVKGELVIYNISGAQVGTINVSQSKVEYRNSDLSSGTYFYRLIDSNKILVSGKFIVK
jgi:hypothetical protein